MCIYQICIYVAHIKVGTYQVGKTHVGTNTKIRCYRMDTFLIRLIKMPLLRIYYVFRYLFVETNPLMQTIIDMYNIIIHIYQRTYEYVRIVGRPTPMKMDQSPAFLRKYQVFKKLSKFPRTKWEAPVLYDYLSV